MRQGVSVCVPAFNEQKRIVSCLESIIAQQGIEIVEILVGVNSSTDRTEERVAAMSARDSRVRAVRSAKGKPHAWNALNSEARCDLRFFQDGDCVAPANTYAQLLRELGDHDIAGASLLGEPPAGSLVARLICFPRRLVHPYPVLNGGLYLMRYSRVREQVMRRSGSAIMPGEIINDDVFLQIMCDRVAVSERAFVLYETSRSIDAEIRRYRRMQTGLFRLQEAYPVRYQGKVDRERAYSRIDILRCRFRHMTAGEKIAAPLVLPLRHLFYRYINAQAARKKPEASVSWK